MRAALLTTGVVRRIFFSALGLMIMVFVILMGMQTVWGALAGQPWATPVGALSVGGLLGIVSNACIASGLAAATMVYYEIRVVPLLRHTSGG